MSRLPSPFASAVLVMLIGSPVKPLRVLESRKVPSPLLRLTATLPLPTKTATSSRPSLLKSPTDKLSPPPGAVTGGVEKLHSVRPSSGSTSGRTGAACGGETLDRFDAELNANGSHMVRLLAMRRSAACPRGSHAPGEPRPSRRTVRRGGRGRAENSSSRHGAGG